MKLLQIIKSSDFLPKFIRKTNVKPKYSDESAQLKYEEERLALELVRAKNALRTEIYNQPNKHKIKVRKNDREFRFN